MIVNNALVSVLIRERRTRKGLNQQELAERLGVARNTIVRWEKGDNPPTEQKRKQLAKHLGGSAKDYQWTEEDFARHDRLAQIKIEVRAHLRRLMSGEEDLQG